MIIYIYEWSVPCLMFCYHVTETWVGFSSLHLFCLDSMSNDGDLYEFNSKHTYRLVTCCCMLHACCRLYTAYILHTVLHTSHCCSCIMRRCITYKCLQMHHYSMLSAHHTVFRQTKQRHCTSVKHCIRLYASSQHRMPYTTAWMQPLHPTHLIPWNRIFDSRLIESFMIQNSCTHDSWLMTHNFTYNLILSHNDS